jgi:hypothetical protein
MSILITCMLARGGWERVPVSGISTVSNVGAAQRCADRSQKHCTGSKK